MTHAIKRFWNDESGPELVEWAVVTIILLVAAVVLYIAVGRALGGIVCAIQCWLLKVSNSSSATMKPGERNFCDDKTNESCE